MHISALELFLDEALVRGDQQISRSGNPAVDILVLAPTDVSASWLLYGDEQSKENPCGDKMIEFLRKTPEARKIVWEMMEREND